MVVGGRGFSVGGAASGCGMPPPVQVWSVNSYVGPRQWPHSNPHCGLHSMHVQLLLTHWNLPSSLPSCAHPSSRTASSWFLPCRWPGILHMGYSRLHVISPCLCATSTSTANSTGTHVNSDTTSNDIRMSFCASFCVCMKDTNSDELVTWESVLPTSWAKIWARCFESW